MLSGYVCADGRGWRDGSVGRLCVHPSAFPSAVEADYDYFLFYVVCCMQDSGLRSGHRYIALLLCMVTTR